MCRVFSNFTVNDMATERPERPNLSRSQPPIIMQELLVLNSKPIYKEPTLLVLATWSRIDNRCFS